MSFVLTRTKSAAIVQLAILLVQFIGVYLLAFILFALVFVILVKDRDPFNFVVPLVFTTAVFVPKVYRIGRILTVGETLRFERSTNQLLSDGKLLCSLSQIADVMVQRSVGFIGNSLRISLVLKNGVNILIDRSTNEDEVLQVARSVAAYIGHDVIEKRQ